MNLYATRTHGAYVQAKGSSMSWNFQEADPEYGGMQGKEMQYHSSASSVAPTRGLELSGSLLRHTCLIRRTCCLPLQLRLLHTAAGSWFLALQIP